MTQRIQHKRQQQTGAAAVGKKPTEAMLLDGELAVNTVDGKLFLKKTPVTGAPEIIEVGANPFPDQTNNGGKYLTTTGTTVTWSTPSTVSAAAIDIVQANHGFAAGTVLYHDGTHYAPARADNVATADVIGIVSKTIDVNKFTLVTNGFVNFQGLIPDGTWTPGSTYFLSATAAGVLTDIEPTGPGTISKPLLVAINSTAYVGDTQSGGPRGFFSNWRGVSNDIPPADINYLLPTQDATTLGKALVSGAGGIAEWGAGSGGAGGASSSVSVTQVAHGFTTGTLVRYDGATQKYVKALADNAANADVIGMVNQVITVDECVITTQGMITGLSGLVPGASYFLSDATAGGMSATEPTAQGAISKPVLMAVSATSGLFVNMRGISISILDTSKEVAPQGGNNGKVLSTNGTNTMWVTSPVGYTGSAGLAGTNGTNGTNGAQGIQGPIGYTGSAGAPANQGLGYGQTWQNVTASRTSGITYTNTTGKPILVSVNCKNDFVFYVSAVQVGRFNIGNSLSDCTGTFVVPDGQTYLLTSVYGLSVWSELR